MAAIIAAQVSLIMLSTVLSLLSVEKMVSVLTMVTATVKAHCPGGQTPAFRLVSQNADGSFSVNNYNQYVSVDAKTGVVTYTGIGQDHIFVEAYSDVATDSAKAPRLFQRRQTRSNLQSF